MFRNECRLSKFIYVLLFNISRIHSVWSSGSTRTVVRGEKLDQWITLLPCFLQEGRPRGKVGRWTCAKQLTLGRFLVHLPLGDLMNVLLYSFILQTCISAECNRSASCTSNIRKFSKRDYFALDAEICKFCILKFALFRVEHESNTFSLCFRYKLRKCTLSCTRNIRL